MLSTQKILWVCLSVNIFNFKLFLKKNYRYEKIIIVIKFEKF